MVRSECLLQESVKLLLSKIQLKYETEHFICKFGGVFDRDKEW